MSPAAWPAPAKLNLFLHVTGRRDDGYHNLQTVFQFLDTGDEIALAPRDDGLLQLAGGAPGVAGEDDLVMRAARLLKSVTGTPLGADIAVDKRLPMGAGLGGGSSDAATTLVGLNALWELDMPDDELARLGLQLGADVPVFVRGQAAWGEGVGEHLEPVQIDEPWYLVVTPPCHVSTREVFEATDLTRNSTPITIRAFLSGQGKNDCEAVVRRRYPQVGEALDWLVAQGLEARMTGTGSSVFAAFETARGAQDVYSRLPTDLPGFVARGRNRSPLLTRLDEGPRG